ncbi:PREDICTED: protein argonaute-2-like isoform X2 [Dinoponera quadriceps]|uniref:Protein argonaute-2-like isoform X2 n=1 Tax=Dinoponera quadriceps TaxID=609295 RepID=A0A6P3XGB5_DINQU|nr:PREDICTED: protein argonaute-2-like isoform X2 [Dinoponera quadriceps]
MPRKGKKKHRVQQEEDTSTSAPSTSEQQSPSQQQQKQPQQSSQQQQKQPQQSSQQQCLPQPVQQQASQPQAWGPRPQQPFPQHQASQPPAWGGSLMHAQQPFPQHQASQPQVWVPRPQPFPRSSSPQVPQQQWAQQPQQLVQQVQRQPVQQVPQQPVQQVPQTPQQGAWRSQQPVQQVPQTPQQGAWRSQQPVQQVPQTSQQGAWRSQQLVQQVPQQYVPQAPQQPVQQVPQQHILQAPQQVARRQEQPVQQVPQQAPTSRPSTSSQQVSGAQQQFERGDASVTRKATSPSSTSSGQLSKVSVPKYKFKSEKDLNIPRRKDPKKAGTVGQRIRVWTNMFEIVFHKNFVDEAVHYDVKVVAIDKLPRGKEGSEPKKRDIKNKTLLREIFERCRSLHFPERYPAYDGMANAFAARDLPFGDSFFSEVEIFDKDRDENRSYEVAINKAGKIDLSWLKYIKPGLDEAIINQTSIQVLDVILRHAPASRLISVGKSLFPPVENKRLEALGKGLDLHVGGFTSAIIGWKPYLNVDVIHKAFATNQTILKLLCQLCGLREESELDEKTVMYYERDICKFLNGLKVNYALPGQPSTKRTFRVNGLGPNSINHKFDVKGKMCSTQEYFASLKNYRINWPTLPCLWVGKRDGKTYLPLELCQVVPGQPINRKLEEEQCTKMIRFAATGTEIRKEKIMTAFNGINVNRSPVTQCEFPVRVNPTMKEVEARILPPPTLQYDSRMQPMKPIRGTWRATKFSTPARLDDATWTIVNICPQPVDNKLPDFVKELTDQASKFGMVIGKPKLPYLKIRGQPREIEQLFTREKDMKLIIVILPNHTDSVYGKVKQISELRVGVLTQCIKVKNIIRPNLSTIQNILLKINSKLNGINHTFAPMGMPECLRNTHYMLIGADVSHPSPDAKNIPSVAAVAASHDETTFKYNVTIRLQQAKQEEIADLKEIMLKHIVFYVKEMRKIPKKIIFYRDGVSEGQIAMVLDKEIRCIKEACREYARVKPEFKPELTFVIVQKRHHIRLFPTRKEDSDDKNYNVKAGTIVDTEITHPNHIDFYLVSHASIQGTARPTKYRCICNESNFSEDQLEELTYHLCHMYARCTRSVSYPAPTYYAHLAAYRGRMWIQGDSYTDSDFQDKNKCKLEPKLICPMSFI